MKTATAKTTTAAPRLVGFPAVAEMLGREPDRVSRTYIWRLVRTGRFPAPLKLSASRIAWRESDIIDFVTALTAVSYAPQAAK